MSSDGASPVSYTHLDVYKRQVDMVFAGKNKEYGAYQLRKGTSGRNIKALLILVIAAALVGGRCV